MGIGAGIFLIALGAILAFAVNVTVSGVSLTAVGVILMIAGAIGIVVDLAIFAPRRRTYARTVEPGYGRTTVVDRDVY
jgi:hypothetical protein